MSGFNQARELARRVGPPVIDALVRPHTFPPVVANKAEFGALVGQEFIWNEDICPVFR